MSFENVFNGSIFGKLKPGMCRLTPSGKIAVKSNRGDGAAVYKSFDVNTGRLTNCTNFVFDVGDEMFFCIPTNKVKRGDIIFVNGFPRCVIEGGKNTFTALNYETGVIETLAPERHVFMGNTYFYGKIVSLWGNFGGVANKDGANNLMKFMFMSQMFAGGDKNTFGGVNANGMFSNPMMLMMMMGNGGMGGFGDMFSNMFDFDALTDMDADDDDDDEDEDEEVVVPMPVKKSAKKATKKNEVTE